MAKFNKGEVVMLNSGGPKMTIISVFPKGATGIESMVFEAYSRKMGSSEAYYVCNWFEGTTLKEGSFTEESISVYKD